ncbi:MAG: hypothetical protein CW341_11425 [Bacteroidetes bacterium]|nr:hypothetical protein [Bacteroidota bacterium]
MSVIVALFVSGKMEREPDSFRQDVLHIEEIKIPESTHIEIFVFLIFDFFCFLAKLMKKTTKNPKYAF